MTLLPAVCKERGSASLVPSSARGRGLLMLDTVRCILHGREIVPSTSVPAVSLHMFSSSDRVLGGERALSFLILHGALYSPWDWERLKTRV